MMNVRAREDAEILYKSISTTYFGIDQKALLNLVGRRSNQHMQLVRDEFEKLYGKDLVKEIENNVSFKFKKLLVGLIKSYPEYRGEEVYDSLKGLITDKWALVDFIIGNDPRSVEEFKQFFRQKYGISLSDLIAQEVSGDFGEVLLLALEARRGIGVEEDLVEGDVLDVFRVAEGHVKEDVGKLLGTIMTQRSHEHLAAVSGKYKQRHNQTLEEALTNCTSGWFQTALVSCLDPLPRYWAKRVRQSLKSFFTDDSLLVRCFSQCSKPFLQEIAVEYLSLYDVTLVRDINSETSGDYGELLLTLLDYPESEKDQYSLKITN